MGIGKIANVVVQKSAKLIKKTAPKADDGLDALSKLLSPMLKEANGLSISKLGYVAKSKADDGLADAFSKLLSPILKDPNVFSDGLSISKLGYVAKSKKIVNAKNIVKPVDTRKPIKIKLPIFAKWFEEESKLAKAHGREVRNFDEIFKDDYTFLTKLKKSLGKFFGTKTQKQENALVSQFQDLVNKGAIDLDTANCYKLGKPNAFSVVDADELKKASSKFEDLKISYGDASRRNRDNRIKIKV